jgi:hypothetical protein
MQAKTMTADLLWGLAIGAQVMACVGVCVMHRARDQQRIMYGHGILYDAAGECGVPSAMAWTSGDHTHTLTV